MRGIDNMQEFDEIWNYALDELGKSFSAAFMNVWFKDTRLVSLTETAAIIYVPSDLKRGMLEKNQSGAIADALESIIGYRAELIFTNDENSSAASEAVFEEEEPVAAEQEPEPSFFTQGQSVQETTESHSMEYIFLYFSKVDGVGQRCMLRNAFSM